MRRKQQAPETGLLAAVKQLSTILKDDGSILETHVALRNGWAVAFNGVIAIGEPIKEDLIACPNGLMLKEALSKCGQGFTIINADNKLTIKGERFKAIIPCLPIEDVQSAFPDQPCASIDDRLKASLLAVGGLPTDENFLLTGSVLIHRGTCTTTDRKLIIQSWHGIDLPPMLAIPKAIIKPLVNNAKKLTQFGFSKSSCTFFYEDSSWLKTQYYAEQWPDVSSILDKRTNAWPLPENFYEGIKALEPFSETGFVFFDSNVMKSHEDEGIGATFDIKGLPKGPVLNIKQLKTIEPLIKTADFQVPHNNHRMTLFYGNNVRGAIAGRV